MTNPWYNLKKIKPSSRDDLLAWAKGRKVRAVRWKEKDLWLENLSAATVPAFVRGEDKDHYGVLEGWDFEWEAVDE